MYRLEFETPSIDDLQAVTHDLVLKPFIAFEEIQFLQPVKVRILARGRIRPRSNSKIRCFYLITYANNVYKIGSSTCENVVTRMYTQAPVTGVLVSMVLLRGHGDTVRVSQGVENKLARMLGGRYKVVSTKNHYVIKGHIEKLAMRNNVLPLDSLKYAEEIAQEAWLLLRQMRNNTHIQVLSSMNTLMFTTKITDDDLALLRDWLTRKKLMIGFDELKPRRDYELIVFHNGLCLLYPSENNDYAHIYTCDKLVFDYSIDLRG